MTPVTASAHARRQSRSTHPPPDRLEEPRLLRRSVGLEGDGAGVRHLPRLPPLREPVPELPEAVRPGRRHRRRRGARRQEGRLLEGGRPVLPVRPVLHDQVPVHAAARVEPGLPAPDAARQGDQVQEGRGQARREVSGHHRRARPVRRHPGRGAGGQRGQPHEVRAQAMDKVLGVHPDAWMPELATQALPLERGQDGTRQRR